VAFAVSFCRTRASMQFEILALRHQLTPQGGADGTARSAGRPALSFRDPQSGTRTVCAECPRSTQGTIDEADELLTLTGLKLIYDLNR